MTAPEVDVVEGGEEIDPFQRASEDVIGCNKTKSSDAVVLSNGHAESSSSKSMAFGGVGRRLLRLWDAEVFGVILSPIWIQTRDQRDRLDLSLQCRCN